MFAWRRTPESLGDTEVMAKAPDWMFRQSAVMPYRRDNSDLEVLLVTSRKGKRWVLPKGVVERGMTAEDSALKEALEEAGIRGSVKGRALGTYRYRKWRGVCTVEVFAMAVEKELPTWPECAVRKRKWHSIEDARKRLDEPELKAIVDHFAKQMEPDAR